MSVSVDMRWALTARIVLMAVVVGLSAWLLWCVPDAGAAGSCPNEGFRTGPSAALPDCRAYEMVSPPDKNGGEVDGGILKGAMAAPEQAAADGEAVTYASTSAFVEAEPKSAVVASQYLSTRTADGWRTREIVPTQQLPEGKLLTLGYGAPDFSLFQGFSENLEGGFLLAWNPQPDPLAPAGYFNPYLFDAGSGGYQILSEEVTPPVQSPGQATLEGPGFGAVYGGMSANGQHVIFEANDALTPEAVPGRVNLYEWSAGRPLELVSVLPEGTVDSSGGKDPLESGVSMTFGAPGSEEMPSLDGALSSNGMRAFWSGGSTTGGQLYMHEITDSGARTVDVSESQKSGQPDGGGEYWAASVEGSFVYFTSGLQLTDDSTVTAGGEDLYQYDVNTGELSDLTVDPKAGETAGVQAVLGIGESGGEPYVYFVAGGVLAGNENSDGEKATPQTCLPANRGSTLVSPPTPCNLYVSHGGQATFIATLHGFYGEAQDFEASVKKRTSRVSPNGQLLAFQSTRPLTGYDNIPADGQSCPEPVRGGNEEKLYREPPEGRCMEVFEYDAQTAKLTCVSCEPGGLPPTGNSMLPETPHLYENIRGWESSTVQQRYLLNDGRLFFQSEDALLAQATNGRQNIYEYEPEGVGQCAASGSGDCQYLISTGVSSANSYFADASMDGRDVFFLTNEQLVPQDGDQATDMYDAREGGGFSSATPPPCSGEACKPAVTPAPAIYGAPSSATFQGAGDIPAQPATRPSAKTTKKTRAKTKVKKKGSAKFKKKGKRITRRAARRLVRRSGQGRR
jgi:hypothetical protein